MRYLIKLSGAAIDAYCEVGDDVADLYLAEGYVEVNEPVPRGVRYWANGGPVLPPAGEHMAYSPETGQWSQDTVAAWAAVRTRRSHMLANSDWVTLRAADQGGPVPIAWRQYRQALRDVTNQPDPFNIVWPTPPA